MFYGKGERISKNASVEISSISCPISMPMDSCARFLPQTAMNAERAAPRCLGDGLQGLPVKHLYHVNPLNNVSSQDTSTVEIQILFLSKNVLEESNEV